MSPYYLSSDTPLEVSTSQVASISRALASHIVFSISTGLSHPPSTSRYIHPKPFCPLSIAMSGPSHTSSSLNIHVESTVKAIRDENDYAAHNYHPLPVVFAKAEGVRVWDPEVWIYLFILRPILAVVVEG